MEFVNRVSKDKSSGNAPKSAPRNEAWLRYPCGIRGRESCSRPLLRFVPGILWKDLLVTSFGDGLPIQPPSSLLFLFLAPLSISPTHPGLSCFTHPASGYFRARFSSENAKIRSLPIPSLDCMPPERSARLKFVILTTPTTCIAWPSRLPVSDPLIDRRWCSVCSNLVADPSPSFSRCHRTAHHVRGTQCWALGGRCPSDGGGEMAVSSRKLETCGCKHFF